MQIGNLTIKIGADIAGLSSALGTANAQLEASSKKFKKAGEGFNQLGNKLSVGLTLPLLGAGAASLKVAGDFEKSMAEVSTLVSDPDMMAPLTTSVRKMSKEFGSMPTEQASALYQIISAGATTAAQANDLLAASNKLAIGGVTDIKTAADGLTTIMNAYGKEAGTAVNVSDAMFVAMRAGKTTIGELSSSIGAVAPLAAQAGASLEEVLSATAALTKGGVTTSVAMTGLRAVMASVVKPSKEASDLAAELGLSFDAAALKTKGLAGFLEDVALKTGGSTEKLAKLFGGVEALSPVLTLTGKAAGDFSAGLDAMSKRAGETEAAFAKMAGTSTFKFDQAKAALVGAAVGFGAAILPALVPVLNTIADVANAFAGLPGPVQTTIVAFGALAAAIGPALKMIGLFIKIAPLMGTAITIATGPVGLAIAAFALLVAAVVGVKKAWDNWDSIKKIAADTYAGVKLWLFDKFAGLVAGIGKLVGKVTGFFRDMWDKVVGNSYVPDMVKGIGVEFAKLDDTMVKKSGKATKKVIDYFSIMQSRVSTLLSLADVMKDSGEKNKSLGTTLARAYDNATAALARQKDQLSENALTLRRMIQDIERVRINAVDLKIKDVKLTIAPVNQISNTRATGADAAPAIDGAAAAVIRMSYAMDMAGKGIRDASFGAISGLNQFASDLVRMTQNQVSKGLGLGEALKGGLAFAVVMEVINGALVPLAPLITGILAPLSALGNVVGQFLAPVFRVLAIAASYLAEGLYRTGSFILSGIGKLMEGIGKVLNKLPGSIGNPLIALGTSMRTQADELEASAAAQKKYRHELIHGVGSFEAATDAVRSFTGSLNVPAMYDYTLRRRQAAAVGYGIPTTPTAAPASQTRAPVTINIHEGAIVVDGSKSPRETAQEVVREIARGLGAIGGRDTEVLSFNLQMAVA